MSSLSGRVRSAITPECNNLSRSIKNISMFNMILLFISLVVLLGAVLYNYLKKVPSGTDAGTVENKKKKVVGAATITSTVLLAISFLTSVWDYVIAAKTANQCLPSSIN